MKIKAAARNSNAAVKTARGKTNRPARLLSRTTNVFRTISLVYGLLRSGHSSIGEMSRERKLIRCTSEKLLVHQEPEKRKTALSIRTVSSILGDLFSKHPSCTSSGYPALGTVASPARLPAPLRVTPNASDG